MAPMRRWYQHQELTSLVVSGRPMAEVSSSRAIGLDVTKCGAWPLTVLTRCSLRLLVAQTCHSTGAGLQTAPGLCLPRRAAQPATMICSLSHRMDRTGPISLIRPTLPNSGRHGGVIRRQLPFQCVHQLFSGRRLQAQH